MSTNDGVSFEQPCPGVHAVKGGTHHHTQRVYALIQLNFNGSNTFGTIKISSRQG